MLVPDRDKTSESSGTVVFVLTRWSSLRSRSGARVYFVTRSIVRIVACWAVVWIRRLNFCEDILKKKKYLGSDHLDISSPIWAGIQMVVSDHNRLSANAPGCKFQCRDTVARHICSLLRLAHSVPSLWMLDLDRQSSSGRPSHCISDR